MNNPLRHLTENALGFGGENIDENVQNGKENASKTNGNHTPTSTKPTFFIWYKEHRDELSEEKPDLIPAELTKYAMGKYQSIYSNIKTPKSSDGSAKRKISTDDANQSQSGIAKLAKFNFDK